jgi:hypothetical protein
LTGEDKLLGMATRGNARSGDNFLQALSHIEVSQVPFFPLPVTEAKKVARPRASVQHHRARQWRVAIKPSQLQPISQQS